MYRLNMEYQKKHTGNGTYRCTCCLTQYFHVQAMSQEVIFIHNTIIRSSTITKRLSIFRHPLSPSYICVAVLQSVYTV